MASFTDIKGRVWEVRFTYGPLLRAIREAGFDPMKAGRKETYAQAFDPLDDPDTFGRVLWELVREQAEKDGLDSDGLTSAIDGPTYFAARDAVVAATTDFTQRPKLAEATNARLSAVMTEMETTAVAKIRAIPTGLIVSAGSSPPSPDSPPPDTPSAS